ncbi:hypothetical protein ACTMU2_40160 [Cupriavidus basilensis]
MPPLVMKDIGISVSRTLAAGHSARAEPRPGAAAAARGRPWATRLGFRPLMMSGSLLGVDRGWSWLATSHGLVGDDAGRGRGAIGASMACTGSAIAMWPGAARLRSPAAKRSIGAGVWVSGAGSLVR